MQALELSALRLLGLGYLRRFISVRVLSESGAGALTALHRSQELKAPHKAGACNKFLKMWISSNGALAVGGDRSTPLLRWRTGRLPALFAGCREDALGLVGASRDWKLDDCRGP